MSPHPIARRLRPRSTDLRFARAAARTSVLAAFFCGSGAAAVRRHVRGRRPGSVGGTTGRMRVHCRHGTEHRSARAGANEARQRAYFALVRAHGAGRRRRRGWCPRTSRRTRPRLALGRRCGRAFADRYRPLSGGASPLRALERVQSLPQARFAGTATSIIFGLGRRRARIWAT